MCPQKHNYGVINMKKKGFTLIMLKETTKAGIYIKVNP